MSPYRERYRSELRELRRDVNKLLAIVDLAVERSVEALRDYDMDKASDVIQNDQIVDDLNLKIEKRCMRLLALQQPMAKDLRLIIAILKIGIDLERIGDMGVDIARVVIHSKNKVHVKRLENIPLMAEKSRQMLAQAEKAFRENDAEQGGLRGRRPLREGERFPLQDYSRKPHPYRRCHAPLPGEQASRAHWRPRV